MAGSQKPPIIIIKRIKKVSHGGHHGGAWKVAYADFVTAMMAFFLLMWLLNATTEEQRKGISNYFGPSGELVGSGGSGGILGGTALEKDGNFHETRASSPMDADHIKQEENAKTKNQDDTEEESQASSSHTVENTDTQSDSGKFDEKKAKKVIEQFENEKFKEAEQQLRQAIQDIPDIKELAENLIIDQTPEGLRIQIVDQQRRSMFPNGSADMYPYTRKLIQYVEKVIEKLPNKISITGHTDGKPYSDGAKYTNWELSSDRANATRRALLDFGLKPDRLIYVSGKAETEPLNASNALSDQNRRISIVLHRTEQETTPKAVPVKK